MKWNCCCKKNPTFSFWNIAFKPEKNDEFNTSLTKGDGAVKLKKIKPWKVEMKYLNKKKNVSLTKCQLRNKVKKKKLSR